MARVPHDEFRGVGTTLAHPRDHDGELLFRHLQRLGCIVEFRWPPTTPAEHDVEVLFCVVDEPARRLLEFYSSRSTTAVIGVADPRNPRVLQLLNDLAPHAVVTKPFDAAAIMSSFVVARRNLSYQRRLLTKVAKLEETLRSFRRVELAKSILMEKRSIDEPAAYAYLRDQAMRRRVPIGVVATVVIDAQNVLSPEID